MLGTKWTFRTPHIPQSRANVARHRFHPRDQTIRQSCTTARLNNVVVPFLRPLPSYDVMSANANPTPTADCAHARIATALDQWYAQHSSIRRLTVFEGAIAMDVLLSLEPTSDGDDALPVWLANSDLWASELSVLVGREIRVQLLAGTSFTKPGIDSNAALITDLSWRDPWLSP